MLDKILNAAEQLGGTAGLQELDNAAIGNTGIVATFEDPTSAEEFRRRIERAGGALIRQRLTREAALSWVGSHGNVKSAGSAAYGGSITRGGAIEQLDEQRLRIVPQATFGGFNLGASTFGSETGGDVAIADIIDITPY